MKVWIFEDRQSTVEILKASLLRRVPDMVFEILGTVEAGDRAIQWIEDHDVVSVDSQVPSEATGRSLYDAGERFVAKLRANSCVCKILWHSDVHLDSLRDLGVEYTNATDIGEMVCASGPSAMQEASREEWQRNGDALLAKRTAWNVPLSEFVPLSILCQGYLAIVGAAGLFPNEVADELKKSEVGLECIAQAHAHLGQALNAVEWFAAGREKISAAVKRAGAGEEVYWGGVGEGQAKLEEVATIRRLYEKVGEQGNQGAGEELHRLVFNAHRSLQNLFARRYL
jgi:hypothetical protein